LRVEKALGVSKSRKKILRDAFFVDIY